MNVTNNHRPTGAMVLSAKLAPASAFQTDLRAVYARLHTSTRSELLRRVLATVAVVMLWLGGWNIPSAAAEEVPVKSSQPKRVVKPEQNEKRRYLVEKRGGIVYQSSDAFELKCDLYLPVHRPGSASNPASTTRYPAIVAVHGGAWRSGSKVSMMRHANLFAKHGYVVMAINYRHAPKFQFPAQIHDCKFAVRWLKANADRYQVDPNRVGAFGYSAGGHLVALLGTTDTDDDLEGDVPQELQRFDSSVVCVSAGGAPCDFSWIGEDSTVLRPWLGNTRGESPEAYQKASPISYADSKDSAFFLFHGQHDLVVPIETSQKLHQALLDAEVASTHKTALLSGHLSTFGAMVWANKTVRFFDKYLKPAKP